MFSNRGCSASQDDTAPREHAANSYLLKVNNLKDMTVDTEAPNQLVVYFQ
jgi:hypothetical protein